jgi:hypothetical protein
VSNRGITRGRLFMGTLLLIAAIITWGIAFLMSPHGEPSAPGMEQVRPTIVVYVRNTAIGTLILCALSGWLLFPRRRPKKPVRDWAVAVILAVMAVSSVYELIWLRTVTH